MRSLCRACPLCHLFFLALVLPLYFLHRVCLFVSIQWLKYRLFSPVPQAVPGIFLPWESIFSQSAGLLNFPRNPLLLLGLLATLIYGRVCADLALMADN